MKSTIIKVRNKRSDLDDSVHSPCIRFHTIEWTTATENDTTARYLRQIVHGKTSAASRSTWANCIENHFNELNHFSPVVPPSNHIICHLSATTDPATASKSVHSSDFDNFPTALLCFRQRFADMLICCLHKHSTLVKVDKILYSDSAIPKGMASSSSSTSSVFYRKVSLICRCTATLPC